MAFLSATATASSLFYSLPLYQYLPETTHRPRAQRQKQSHMSRVGIIRSCSGPASSNLPSPSSSLGFDLRKYWTALIEEINRKLEESIPVSCPYTERIYEAMRYSVLAKGAKRASPVMCITAFELFGGHRLTAFPTACALEMVHAASLIHDDLPSMDDDQVRRNQPANHVVYGEDMAILAGDALFPLGFHHIVSHTPPELVPRTQLLQVIAEIARTVGSTGMAAGQYLDLECEPNAVEFIQEKKFGELAECSAVCGGLLAGANDDEIQRLRRYGKTVGILYQLVDDILEEKVKNENRQGVTTRKVKSYISVYGVDKAIEVAENLRAQAKRELDGFVKYGEKVWPLQSFVDYAADRGFNISG